MLQEIDALIQRYHLERLPIEGTLFASTYRSKQELPNGKPCGTGMIGLYSSEPRSVSLFHRLSEDEMWHFYGGDPLRLVLLHPDGTSEDVIMGGAPLKGQHVQFVIPAGVWQAGEVLDAGRYSLFGCTLAPGFTDDIFEGGTADVLRKMYPGRAEDIDRLGCAHDAIRMPKGFAS